MLLLSLIDYLTLGAQESLYEKVNLKPCSMDLSLIMTPSDHQAIAASTEQLETIEECMNVWVKQIEQVSISNYIIMCDHKLYGCRVEVFC